MFQNFKAGNKKKRSQVYPQVSEVKFKKNRQVKCELCFNNIKPYRMARLCHCQHTFCENCLMTYTLMKLKDFKLITCPEENCNSLVDEQCGLYWNLTQNEKRKYEKIKFRKSIEGRTDVRLCPDQHCEKGLIELRKNQNNGTCLLCKVTFCLKCAQPRHKGFKCNDDDDQAKKLMKAFKYKRCDRCKKVVEKIQGCNHITCSCGNQFCYICGKAWGSNSHICRENREQQFQRDSVCFKLNSCLNFLSCVPFLEWEDEDLSCCQKVQKCLLLALKKIAFVFFIFFWVLLCIIYSILAFFAVLVYYLVVPSFQVYAEVCRWNKPALAILIILLIEIIFLPIVLIGLGIVFFLENYQRGRHQWIWRFCWTASIQR